jgi:uncharacterized protein YeaO (DUF488 family)
MQIWTRRVYDPPTTRDGARILVDRVWPRGISKQEARLQDWHREVAPSTELRRWFGHEPERWDGFRERYFAELDANPDAVARIREAARRGRVTLVFGARDQRRNNAVALREYLLRAASET